MTPAQSRRKRAILAAVIAAVVAFAIFAAPSGISWLSARTELSSKKEQASTPVAVPAAAEARLDAALRYSDARTREFLTQAAGAQVTLASVGNDGDVPAGLVARRVWNLKVAGTPAQIGEAIDRMVAFPEGVPARQRYLDAPSGRPLIYLTGLVGKDGRSGFTAEVTLTQFIHATK